MLTKTDEENERPVEKAQAPQDNIYGRASAVTTPVSNNESRQSGSKFMQIDDHEGVLWGMPWLGDSLNFMRYWFGLIDSS